MPDAGQDQNPVFPNLEKVYVASNEVEKWSWITNGKMFKRSCRELFKVLSNILLEILRKTNYYFASIECIPAEIRMKCLQSASLGTCNLLLVSLFPCSTIWRYRAAGKQHVASTEARLMNTHIWRYNTLKSVFPVWKGSYLTSADRLRRTC